MPHSHTKSYFSPSTIVLYRVLKTVGTGIRIQPSRPPRFANMSCHHCPPPSKDKAHRASKDNGLFARLLSLTPTILPEGSALLSSSCCWLPVSCSISPDDLHLFSNQPSTDGPRLCLLRLRDHYRRRAQAPPCLPGYLHRHPRLEHRARGLDSPEYCPRDRLCGALGLDGI